MLTASDALKRLQDGNKRFVSGDSSNASGIHQVRSSDLGTEQNPFAVVVSCSDLTVPAEMVFDQKLGDLFVIRVAGNVVASSQIDSVEFAVQVYGTPLVVVLGHTQCTAVATTIDDLTQQASGHSNDLHAVANRVRPAVEALLATDLYADKEALLKQAIRTNVLGSSNQLRHSSVTLEQMVLQSKLLIVGAEYSLETGKVDFFDVPQTQV